MISNAIKFTPKTGRVSVASSLLNERLVQVVVSDSGCGIAPQELPKVFNEFSKVESAVPASQGAQLGLFITKSLVQLHGGKMWVESRLGGGTQFFFTLPIEPEPPTTP